MPWSCDIRGAKYVIVWFAGMFVDNGVRVVVDNTNPGEPALKKCFLRALLYKEDGEYAAHCLEFDIAGTSKESFEDACDELNELIQVHIEYAYENDNLEHLYKPAPAKYWNMLHRSDSYDRDNQKTIEVGDRSFEPQLSVYPHSPAVA